MVIGTMERKKVVVVGGGPAGCAAAIEAAKLGLCVTLVDEHPQSLAAMSLDAPYFYGAGLPNVLSNRGLMAETVLGANNLLIECVENGIDVLTSTIVWGSYRPGENSTQLETGQLGLADDKRSWMIEYDHLILAPGARDLVLPFPNWHLPGVLGACGASALLDRYKVFGGDGLVILGSGNLGLRTALSAQRAGIRVAGIVDVADTVQGDARLAAQLREVGVPFYLARTVVQALGKLDVEGLRIAKVDHATAPFSDTTQDIACGAICMAFAAVPNIELAAVTGCRTGFDAARGGWIPVVDATMQTSQKSVFVVGDGAMVSEAMHLDPRIAMEQGRLAARAIAAVEGFGACVAAPAVQDSKSLYPPTLWHRTLVNAGGLDVVVCQCEDVTRREILDLSPPKYLQAANRNLGGGLAGLSVHGRSSQDQIKRLTRAGMGHCQGKRCRDHSAMLLAESASCNLAAIIPGSYRTPVRPLSLSILWPEDESEGTRRNWRTWVHAADGIPEL